MATPGCGSRRSPAAADPSGKPNARSEAERVRRLVQSTQRAGFERHEFETYMRAWSAEARMVLGRGPEPGEHATVWDRKHLEASRWMRFQGEAPPERSLEMDDIEVDARRRRAVLRARTAMSDEGMQEVVREIYRLRRTGDGWRIVENISWPVRKTQGGRTVRYDAETWQKLDRAIAELRRDSDDPRSLIGPLLNAYRFREAYEAACRATEGREPSVGDWMRRAGLAVTLGKKADAVRSYLRARELGPAPIPGWVERAAEAR